jgi:predicted outer membrane protein
MRPCRSMLQRIVGVAATFALLASVTTAADAPTANRLRANRAPQQGGIRVNVNKPVLDDNATGQNTDRTIANLLAMGDEEEIAMAKLALSKTENKWVREFAETIIKDHNDSLSKLERFGVQPQQLTAQSQDRAGDGAQPGQPGRFDLLTVKRQIAQQCLAMAQQKAGETKDASERDMCYVGHQVVAHEHMLSAQKVLRQYASSELQQLIDKKMETAEMHKDHAQKLMDDLIHAEHDRIREQAKQAKQ